MVEWGTMARKKTDAAKGSEVVYTGSEVTPAEPVASKATAQNTDIVPVHKTVSPPRSGSTVASEEENAPKDKENRRETHNLLKHLKILTAIMLGKDKNKELSQVLDADKSFTSKQIRELEVAGLVKKEVEGREVKYSVDKFNLMKFLQQKVIIKWKKEEGRQ